MRVTYRQRSWEIEEQITVHQLLKRIRLLPESVLVLQNGKLVTEDQLLAVEDEIKVVAVISGG